ncbi:MAG TPA: hypothetical protein VKH19_11635 [Gemmatimonadaceae bacterium]|nr:hypothetical protein [Gemmatimonadaceae bacterium]
MRRSKRWFLIASIFTLINVLGAPLALVAHEGMHLTLHIVLAAVGAFFMWHFAGARRAEAALGGAQVEGDAAGAERQMAELQQSVDAIAVEVERIGESQRYAVKLAAERVAAEKARQPRSDKP